MSSFPDVEQFAKQHRSCGSLTPSISSPAKGGYLLTVMCSCGQSFERWVSDAEATLDGPPAAGSLPPGSSGASLTPPSRASAPSPRLDTPAARAVEPVSVPNPKPQAVPEAPRTPLGVFAPENREPGTGTGTAAAATRPAPRGATAARPITPEPKKKPHARTTTVVVLAIALVILAAGFGAWQYGKRLTSSPTPIAPNGAPSSARPPLGDPERAAVTGALTALRELQAVSRVEIPSRIYLSRVAFTKTDIERNLAGVTDPDLRTALTEALALHLLAADAWKAKTLNERGKWEAVGGDAGVEPCPAAKRVVAVADEPPGMSRAQWRGVALAAAIPLLWDCAANRLAELDRALKER
jgi:hypothetical protein